VANPAENPLASSPASAGNPATGTPTAQPLASGTTAPAPLTPAAGIAGKPLLFGGHKGGRKTDSGFPVDSPEHKEFVRARDAERKRAARSRERHEQTPPLLPPTVGGLPEPAPRDLGTVASPAGSPAPQVFPVAGLPGGEIAPPVGWLAKDVEPLVKEAIELGEEFSKSTVLKKCRKAGLPAPVVKEIEGDLKWLPRAKEMLADGLAEIGVQKLNESQVPVEAKPYMKICIGGLQIGIGQMKIISRLDKLIELHEQTKPAPASDGKEIKK